VIFDHFFTSLFRKDDWKDEVFQYERSLSDFSIPIKKFQWRKFYNL